MPPHDRQVPDALPRPAAYPLGEAVGRPEGERALALLALSHTPFEHQLYRCMLDAVTAADASLGSFSARHLMALTRVFSLKKIRRALTGLQSKLSIERQRVAGAVPPCDERAAPVYAVFRPEEVLARRAAAGLSSDAGGADASEDGEESFRLAVGRVSERYRLSRREAQVALYCAEGMTNAEIGRQLGVREQTVKFHMRNLLAKFGVRRRTELVSSFLLQEFEQDRGFRIADCGFRIADS